jgi:hypothetical protein
MTGCDCDKWNISMVICDTDFPQWLIKSWWFWIDDFNLVTMILWSSSFLVTARKSWLDPHILEYRTSWYIYIYSICRCFSKVAKYNSVQIVLLKCSTKITRLNMIKQNKYNSAKDNICFWFTETLKFSPLKLQIQIQMYVVSWCKNEFCQQYCHNCQLVFLIDGNWRKKSSLKLQVEM